MTRGKKYYSDEKNGKPDSRLEGLVIPLEDMYRRPNCQSYFYSPIDAENEEGHYCLSSLDYTSLGISTCKKPGCEIRIVRRVGDRIVFSCSCPEETRIMSYRFDARDILTSHDIIFKRISATRTRRSTSVLSIGNTKATYHGIEHTDSVVKHNDFYYGIYGNRDMKPNQRNMMMLMLLLLQMAGLKSSDSEIGGQQKLLLLLILHTILQHMGNTKTLELCSKGEDKGLTKRNMPNDLIMLGYATENISGRINGESRMSLSDSNKISEKEKGCMESSHENHHYSSYNNIDLEERTEKENDESIYLEEKIDKEKDILEEVDKFEEKGVMSTMVKLPHYSKLSGRKSTRGFGTTISLFMNRGIKGPTMVVSNIENLRKLLRGALDKESFEKSGHGVKFYFLSHGDVDFNHGKVTLIPLLGFNINELDMSIYLNRLCTYHNWPTDSPLSSLKLANAGFIYRGNGHTVECFSCGLSVSEFQNNLSPLQLHQQMADDCNFLRSLDLNPAGNFERINTLSSAEEGMAMEIKQNIDRMIDGVTTQIEGHLELKTDEDTDTNERKTSVTNDQTLISQTHRNNEPYPTDIEEDNMASERGHAIAQASGYSDTNLSRLDKSNINMNESLCDGAVRKERNEWSTLNDNIYGSAKHVQYATITSRLESFKSWSYNNIQQPANLVDAGFYYIGKEDIVRCFYCDIGLAEWDEDDDPWVEHARHSPQCLYVKIKRGEDFIENIQSSWRRIYCPKHQKYEQYPERLQTFTGWPSTATQRPEQLASAGFFYTGEDDTVRCHYCDGGLRQWEPGDIPWTEHARWFPFCKYVIKIKGIAFIEDVNRRYNEMYSSQSEVQNSAGSNIPNNPERRSDTTKNQPKCKSALEATAAKSVLEMGYSNNTVKAAINEYIKRFGNRDFVAEEIMEIIFQFDDIIKEDDSPTKADEKIIKNEKDDVKNLDFEKLDNKRLRQVNKQMKEEIFQCRYCKDKDRNMVFIPCGHRIACESCSKDIKVCSECSAFVDKSVKTFLS